MNLKGRVAVITGAGSGIGRATALSLARRGCHLALCDIDESALEQSQAQVSATGMRASAHPLDVASREAVAALPAAVFEAHGRADLLINNAGVALAGNFDQVSEADFDWLMEINFHAVVRMTRAFPAAAESQRRCPYRQPVERFRPDLSSRPKRLLRQQVRRARLLQCVASRTGRHPGPCQCGASRRGGHGDSAQCTRCECSVGRGAPPPHGAGRQAAASRCLRKPAK